MILKIIGLIALILLFLLTMSRIKDIIANLMYLPSLTDETMARNYRGVFQKKDLLALNAINLTMNLLLATNVIFLGVLLMTGRPENFTISLAIVDLCASLVAIFFAYGSNSSAYEIVSQFVVKAKNIKDFSGDEQDLCFDTQNNIEQTYILLFVSLLFFLLMFFAK